MSDVFTHKSSGRNGATLATVVLVWAGLTALIFLIDLAPWIAGVVALATVPAVIDLITARAAGVSVSAENITWFAGSKTGEVAWDRVDHVRFDTRLDLSVRAALVLHNYRRVKIPFEATPPHREFEAELQSRGIRTERHHFGFM